jgi:ketosteroid isomerase-like protein
MTARMAPTEADLDHVRRAFEAFDVRREHLDAYFERYFTPDGVIELADDFPIRGRYEGAEGFRRWFEDSYAAYDDVRRRLDSITIEGEHVVALMTITGRPRGDATELQIQMGNTYRLEGGRIRHLRVYVGHERALAAARDA